MTIYVSFSGGNDNNDGLLPATAWQTIAKVNADLPAGESVLFKRGEAWSGTQLNIVQSGTETQPFVVGAYGTGPAPTLRNPGVLWDGVIRLAGCWIVAENLHWSDAHRHGVLIEGEHNIVQDCEMDTVGIGTDVVGQYAIVRNNYIHDLTMIVDDEEERTDYGATGIRFVGGGNSEAYSNTLLRCRATSTNYGYGGGAFEFWVPEGVHAAGVRIHHNYTEQCKGFVELGGVPGTECANVEIYSNISRNNRGIGAFHTAGRFAVNIDGVVMRNNVIVEFAQDAQDYNLLGFDEGVDSTQFAFVDNTAPWRRRAGIRPCVFQLGEYASRGQYIRSGARYCAGEADIRTRAR